MFNSSGGSWLRISVDLGLNSLHLHAAVRNAWTTQWLTTVTSTMKEAEKQLKTSINEIDKVILCGGCGQVPYLRNFIAQSLSKWLRSSDDVVVGSTQDLLWHVV